MQPLRVWSLRICCFQIGPNIFTSYKKKKMSLCIFFVILQSCVPDHCTDNDLIALRLQMVPVVRLSINMILWRRCYAVTTRSCNQWNWTSWKEVVSRSPPLLVQLYNSPQTPYGILWPQVKIICATKLLNNCESCNILYFDLSKNAKP